MRSNSHRAVGAVTAAAIALTTAGVAPAFAAPKAPSIKPIETSAVNTDISSRRRYRHYGYRHYRPHYRSYGYAPRPYYSGYGGGYGGPYYGGGYGYGPSVTFGYGGGGYRGW